MPSLHYLRGVIMSRDIKFVPFCVLATILPASCPARANTIIFQCGISFAVDLKNNTVNNQPATINAIAIDWHLTPEPADDTGVIFYHIDRTIWSQLFGIRMTFRPRPMNLQQRYARLFVVKQNRVMTELG
jgi:hypothetical protein